MSMAVHLVKVAPSVLGASEQSTLLGRVARGSIRCVKTRCYSDLPQSKSIYNSKGGAFLYRPVSDFACDRFSFCAHLLHIDQACKLHVRPSLPAKCPRSFRKLLPGLSTICQLTLAGTLVKKIYMDLP